MDIETSLSESDKIKIEDAIKDIEMDIKNNKFKFKTDQVSYRVGVDQPIDIKMPDKKGGKNNDESV